jgi:hypothetical protein
MTQEEQQVATEVAQWRRAMEQAARQAQLGVQLLPCAGCEVMIDGSFVEGISKFPSATAPAVSLTSGKWYYEACVLVPGSCPQVGWADDAFLPSASTGGGCGVGDDAHSWAVDGVRVKKWHSGRAGSSTGSAFGSAWAAGDVVGFAVDLDQKTMAFSLNGSWAAPMGQAFAGFAVKGGLRPALALGYAALCGCSS